MAAPVARMTKRLLVVDDDPVIRDGLGMLLEAEGYQVAAAANGEEALLSLYGGERPDLILLDLRMPVVDGWEFRRLQRQDPALAAIPVVVVSAEENPGSLGAAGYLRKPVDIDDLLRVIERHCQPQGHPAGAEAAIVAHRQLWT